MIVRTAHDSVSAVPDLLYIFEFVFHDESGARADKRCFAFDLLGFDGALYLSAAC